MPHIDYYFSTLSPYTYLAGQRFEDVLVGHSASVNYKPLDIISLLNRTGGILPKDRHINRIEYREQELVRQAEKFDLPFNINPAFWPTNAAPSSYAIIAAQNAGDGNLGMLVFSILRAVWAEEKDISQDDVIQASLREAGFDPALSESGLLVGAETYAANLEEAIDKGVFGSPFYIVEDNQRFWGQDKIEDLNQHLSEKFEY
ncbi:MAG: 2-hydroxychromene-2-carboxylate isomerase [Tateyamaria sp.]|jgi:2-hydroxychromene-2-carboxylate isomerase|nr:2-hydroxychromene-2-carboxylate isomerase [Tateyamaria sp.]MBT5300564.1 2-hydroxychromene-2-carboxylate isomerase [Tateyamaria sp.]MBT6267937.1 2-hydroxychromene-2-carboxylate isomerase [Tateyamaria sp.]MBT6343637.1 2-hydroxychromene-2-carboxylate isomerase [Tateyamaria sp.]MBT7446907.1 2-hydroxychromene-2-carboxylate isomerase [Tateyamaria sp.]